MWPGVRGRPQTVAANISSAKVEWLGHGGFCIGSRAAARRFAEVRPPDGVVTRVDLVIEIAIRGQARPLLSECLTPHDVVGSIDGSVSIVIARQGMR